MSYHADPELHFAEQKHAAEKQIAVDELSLNMAKTVEDAQQCKAQVVRSLSQAEKIVDAAQAGNLLVQNQLKADYEAQRLAADDRFFAAQRDAQARRDGLVAAEDAYLEQAKAKYAAGVAGVQARVTEKKIGPTVVPSIYELSKVFGAQVKESIGQAQAHDQEMFSAAYGDAEAASEIEDQKINTRKAAIGTLAEGVKIVHAEATDKADFVSAASTDWWKASEKTAEAAQAAKGDWSWHEKKALEKCGAVKGAGYTGNVGYSAKDFEDMKAQGKINNTANTGYSASDLEMPDAVKARERAIGLSNTTNAWFSEKNFGATQARGIPPNDHLRFELAKVAMGAMLSDLQVWSAAGTYAVLVSTAIKYADEMLKQLKESTT